MENREEVIFKGLEQGLERDQIDKNLYEERHKYGNAVEKNFVRLMHLNFGRMLRYTKDGTEQDDHDGIDLWVYFKKTRSFPWLKGKCFPAQIKSSKEQVDEFRNNPLYKDRGKKILVIDAHKGIDEGKFNKQVLSELRRIGRLLTNEEQIIHS